MYYLYFANVMVTPSIKSTNPYKPDIIHIINNIKNSFIECPKRFPNKSIIPGIKLLVYNNNDPIKHNNPKNLLNKTAIFFLLKNIKGIDLNLFPFNIKLVKYTIKLPQ